MDEVPLYSRPPCSRVKRSAPLAPSVAVWGRYPIKALKKIWRLGASLWLGTQDRRRRRGRGASRWVLETRERFNKGSKRIPGGAIVRMSPLSFSLALSLALFCSFALSRALSLSLAVSLALSIFLSRSLARSLSPALSRSLVLSLTLTLDDT